MTTIFQLNGEAFEFDGDPLTPLVDILRNRLFLTGTKAVCREGFCGACTVHVDGAAVVSCLRPVGSLGGSEVETIEGASRTNPLVQRLQAAFEKLDAVQCGMCFPGMVMGLAPLLANERKLDRAEVKAAMTGNVCRCTGYERIVDAVLSAMVEKEISHV